MSENLEYLSEEQLEVMLLDATAAEVPGRRALARVTAIRTLLARRAQRPPDGAERDAAHALALVNATRPEDRQLTLTELHPSDVASVLANPEWAAFVLSDQELRRVSEARARRVTKRRERQRR